MLKNKKASLDTSGFLKAPMVFESPQPLIVSSSFFGVNVRGCSLIYSFDGDGFSSPSLRSPNFEGVVRVNLEKLFPDIGDKFLSGDKAEPYDKFNYTGPITDCLRLGPARNGSDYVVLKTPVGVEVVINSSYRTMVVRSEDNVLMKFLFADHIPEGVVKAVMVRTSNGIEFRVLDYIIKNKQVVFGERWGKVLTYIKAWSIHRKKKKRMKFGNEEFYFLKADRLDLIGYDFTLDSRCFNYCISLSSGLGQYQEFSPVISACNKLHVLVKNNEVFVFNDIDHNFHVSIGVRVNLLNGVYFALLFKNELMFLSKGVDVGYKFTMLGMIRKIPDSPMMLQYISKNFFKGKSDLSVKCYK